MGGPPIDVTAQRCRTLAAAAQVLADDDASPNARLASDPKTRPAVLAHLALYGRIGVRWRVAANPTCPVDVMTALAQDKIVVGWQLANNPHCNVEALWILAKRQEGGLALEVANNPGCPAEILGYLLVSDDIKVATAARINPNCPDAYKAIVALGGTSPHHGQ